MRLLVVLDAKESVARQGSHYAVLGLLDLPGKVHLTPWDVVVMGEDAADALGDLLHQLRRMDAAAPAAGGGP